jgi:hypothetical protein
MAFLTKVLLKMRYIYDFDLRKIKEPEMEFENDYGCNCVDSKKRPKRLYSTYEKAEEVKRDRRWLKIYPCPEKMGFHLSKV